VLQPVSQRDGTAVSCAFINRARAFPAVRSLTHQGSVSAHRGVDAEMIKFAPLWAEGEIARYLRSESRSCRPRSYPQVTFSPASIPKIRLRCKFDELPDQSRERRFAVGRRTGRWSRCGGLESKQTVTWPLWQNATRQYLEATTTQ